MHHNPKGKGKLMADELPCLLPDDRFYEWVVEFEAFQQTEERDKEIRLEGRADVLAKWREHQEERKAEIG
jgi:hypothetical protein